MTTEDRVRQYILREFEWSGQPDELTPEFPIIDEQVVDSMGLFQIVSFLEEEFGVDVEDDELVPENFASIRAIARMVDSKR